MTADFGLVISKYMYFIVRQPLYTSIPHSIYGKAGKFWLKQKQIFNIYFFLENKNVRNENFFSLSRINLKNSLKSFSMFFRTCFLESKTVVQNFQEKLNKGSHKGQEISKPHMIF